MEWGFFEVFEDFCYNFFLDLWIVLFIISWWLFILIFLVWFFDCCCGSWGFFIFVFDLKMCGCFFIFSDLWFFFKVCVIYLFVKFFFLLIRKLIVFFIIFKLLFNIWNIELLDSFLFIFKFIVYFLLEGGYFVMFL